MLYRLSDYKPVRARRDYFNALLLNITKSVTYTSAFSPSDKKVNVVSVISQHHSVDHGDLDLKVARMILNSFPGIFCVIILIKEEQFMLWILVLTALQEERGSERASAV